MGRKTKYEKDFPQRAEMYARYGLNDEQIAKKLGIDVSTFYEYQKKYSEFSEAIKRGKAPVDYEVENAVLKSAKGFYEDGKYYPPNSTLAIFWLVNRQSNRWRSVNRDHIDQSRPQAVSFKFRIVGEDDGEENED